MMTSALEDSEALERLVTRWCFTHQELNWARRLGLPDRWTRRTECPVGRAALKRSALADLRGKLGNWFDKDPYQASDASFGILDVLASKQVSSSTSAVLAREDACLEVFRSAAIYRKPRIYQLPTAHYATVQRLVQQEILEYPDAL